MIIKALKVWILYLESASKGLGFCLKELYGPSLAICVLGFHVLYIVMFTPCGFN